MTGGEDLGNSPDMARRMAALIPGARWEIVPGLRHMGLAEAPEAFNGPLLDFLDEVRRHFGDLLHVSAIAGMQGATGDRVANVPAVSLHLGALAEHLGGHGEIFQHENSERLAGPCSTVLDAANHSGERKTGPRIAQVEIVQQSQLAEAVGVDDPAILVQGMAGYVEAQELLPLLQSLVLGPLLDRSL